MSVEVSAALFAKDQVRVSAFYRDALGLDCTESDTDHAVLNCSGFELIVHQIPQHFLEAGHADGPANRRGNAAIRLNFPVDSVDRARTLAASLGGQIDDAPPPWAPRDANVFLGHDPEGNVFKVSERGR